jgi:diguanylate cyclase (GGDEF)-like protein/PAS domain S-box-containing protein
MSHVTTFNSELHIIETKVKGIFTAFDCDSLMREVAQTSQETKCLSWLGDFSEAAIAMPAMEIYELPKKSLQTAKSFGINIYQLKRAIVGNSTLSDLQFHEIVSIDRGHPVRFFSTFEKAIGWLVLKQDDATWYIDSQMNDFLPQAILDYLSDGIYFVDKNKVITYWNQSAERITGYNQSEVLGRSCGANILRHMSIEGEELCENGCPLQATIEDGQRRNASVFLHQKKGCRVPVHVRVAPLINAEGVIVGGIETFCDDSKSLDMLEKLESLQKDVFQDPLLKIGNRRLADSIFSAQSYEQTPMGVIFFDIDFFKKVNDFHGHHIGDDILVMVSQSVKNVLRKTDSFFRWGGDEFLILLPHVDEENLRAIATRATLFVEKSFLTIKDKNISVTLSMGATFVRGNETLVSVIKRCDALMYESKRNGRNQVTVG